MHALKFSVVFASTIASYVATAWICNDFSENEDQDKNSDAVIFGYIAVILIFSVIVLLLLIFVVKIKCKNR